MPVSYSSRKILLVFASDLEAQPILKWLQLFDKEGDSFQLNNISVRVLITGPGIFYSVYGVTKVLLQETFDEVINAGICGSFDPNFQVGELLRVVQDEFADCGFTRPDGSFVSLFEADFVDANKFPFSSGKLKLSFSENMQISDVKAITVNQCAGNQQQINRRIDDFHPDIETMEGAAVAYVSMQQGLEFLQLRAVSNRVEVRNKENWDIPLAVRNLTEFLKKILTQKAGL